MSAKQRGGERVTVSRNAAFRRGQKAAEAGCDDGEQLAAGAGEKTRSVLRTPRSVDSQQ